MRLATLHRPDGRTILVNPDQVWFLREPEGDENGNCVIVFANGYEEIAENLAAAAAMIEGPHSGLIGEITRERAR